MEYKKLIKKQEFILLLAGITLYFLLYLSKVDIKICLFFKLHKKDLMHRLFSFISSLGDRESLLFILVFCSLLPIENLKRKEMFLKGLISLILAGVLCIGLKVVIGRPRPSLLSYGYYWPHWVSLKDEFHSTPSGHTITAFTLAYILSRYFPKQRFILFAVAFAIGISRILLFYHYPSDIVVSIILGCVIAKAIFSFEGINSKRKVK